ncbi:ATP-dependent nuclease [Acidovorax sp. Leaf84]|uniref:ATP-dependent nuclease n=1 Tax=Acidovorax sp. Leaf84 TaxID=1736240 RepID=UPI0009EAC919|nr:ATP-binding protein [Acidovorax sp. Leaf84]
MAYQSEIRPSQIQGLLEKAQSKKYAKYLVKINIERARAFDRKSITFDFPVTALVGPNGGGKTTLLGAAACVYASVKPSLFFAKSGKFDASMKNWRFEYEVIDRQMRQNDSVRRTVKFKNLKWSREGLSREVVHIGVSRTVPLTERNDMKRFTGGKFEVPDDQIESLTDDAVEAIGKILDKDFSKFKSVTVDKKGGITIIAGQTSNGDAYSEFHFGAGESSIIRIVLALENVSENSLILIEEIENGLHPLATMRLVEYLIELAERRKLQAIFTTHSNDALTPLPDKAIWAAINGNLYQGKLDIASLRAIGGQVGSKLTIFVEDGFAKSWVEEALRNTSNIALDAIEVHALKGDGTAVRIHLDHNLDPSVKFPSVCLIDGDSKQNDDPKKLIFRLPGDMPETHIYDSVVATLDKSSGELAVAMLRPFEEEGRVRTVIESVGNTNRDAHVLFSQIGRQLNLTPEQRVKDAFLSIWARYYSGEVADIFAQFLALLPVERTDEEAGA